MQDGAKPYFVYVLWSRSARRFYIGSTDDCQERLRQHNEGISRWTRGRGPRELVWSKRFRSRTDARRFENRLKRQKGGRGFYELTGLSGEDSVADTSGS